MRRNSVSWRATLGSHCQLGVFLWPLIVSLLGFAATWLTDLFGLPPHGAVAIGFVAGMLCSSLLSSVSRNLANQSSRLSLLRRNATGRDVLLMFLGMVLLFPLFVGNRAE
ncbi:MAG: hypothetical protein HY744_14985 [Deltaproteobacteria bacterium]|nr:hypothetical protein [Deltaproteobacteria bacterium]